MHATPLYEPRGDTRGSCYSAGSITERTLDPLLWSSEVRALTTGRRRMDALKVRGSRTRLRGSRIFSGCARPESFEISDLAVGGGADSGKNRLKSRPACIIRFPLRWETLGNCRDHASLSDRL